MPTLRSLGASVNSETFPGLDTIELAEDHLLKTIAFNSDEVTAVCPVTQQPDWYKVLITITPENFSIESKSLKLYLQLFRNTGIFAETLCNQICEDIAAACYPKSCTVQIEQKSRGGITLSAWATYDRTKV